MIFSVYKTFITDDTVLMKVYYRVPFYTKIWLNAPNLNKNDKFSPKGNREHGGDSIWKINSCMMSLSCINCT